MMALLVHRTLVMLLLENVVIPKYLVTIVSVVPLILVMPKKVVFIQYKTVAIMMLVLLILVIQVQDVFIPQSPVMMVMPVLLKNAILQ
jgi:hypothetical protein